MKYSVRREGKWKEQCHDIPSFPDIRSLMRMREWSHEKEREREEKIGGDGISDIEIYESVGRADKIRHVNDRKRGRVY